MKSKLNFMKLVSFRNALISANTLSAASGSAPKEGTTFVKTLTPTPPTKKVTR